MSLILPEIKTALAGFVKCDLVAEVISLGLQLRKPVLLYGRGGHGKSEIVRAVFKALAKSDDEWFIQSCGEGMTEAMLYGGLDLDALSRPEGKTMQYYPERSFLNYKYSLLEEFNDAPPAVLLSLKNTITAGQLDNGYQTFEMKTLLLIGATNKNPMEICEMGPTYEALMERFPLQARVEWSSYRREDFLELFNTVEKEDTVPSQMRSLLAQLISDAHDKGQWISPRTAIVCLNLLKASAVLHKRKQVTEDDFFAIKHIPGTEQILEDLSTNLDCIKRVAIAQLQLAEHDEHLTEVLSKMTQYEQNKAIKNREKAILFLQLSTVLENLDQKLQNLSLPDNLVRHRDQLREKIKEGHERAIKLARQFSA